ncbi:MAG: hypothetical protein WCO18_01280 [bacterium]
MKNFRNLRTVIPVWSEPEIGGRELSKLSRRLALGRCLSLGGRKAFNFYKKKKNWCLLPPPGAGVDIILFMRARGKRREDKSVPCLMRWSDSTIWRTGEYFLYKQWLHPNLAVAAV